MRYRYDISKGIEKVKTKAFVAISALSLVLGGGGLLLAVYGVANASSPSQGDLAGDSWKLYSEMPSTAKFWDISQAKSDGNGGSEFQFKRYLNSDSGSFATYFTHNYNNDLTGKTIDVAAMWTPGTYTTRSFDVNTGAYARVEIQDVASGNFSSSDYWWYNGGSMNLNIGNNGNIVADTSDLSHWSNICGQSATDTTSHPGPNCVGGTDPAVSPHDGFMNALKSIKQVNLTFGGNEFFVTGAASVGTDSSMFDLVSYAIN